MKKKFLVIIDILCFMFFSSCGEMTEVAIQESETISESVIISEENSEENESENQIQNYNVPENMTLTLKNINMNIDNCSEIFNMLKSLDFNSDLFITDTSKAEMEIKFEYNEDNEKYLIFSDAVGYIPSMNQDTIQFAEINNEFYDKITDVIINQIAENNFFAYYDEDIIYSEPYESHILDNFSSIIESGIYNEYFIEINSEYGDMVHDIDIFNEWKYYKIYSDCYYYDMIQKGDTGYECIDGETYQKYDSETSFLNNIINNYSYDESFYFTLKHQKYICEKYISGNNKCFLYFAEGELQFAIKLESDNIMIICNYHLYPKTQLVDSINAEEELSYIYSKYEKSALYFEESSESENYENELFDFSAERIRMEDIENPHIVENYRDFFDTADEFSIYITAKRGDLMMSNRATKSGDSYYYMSSTQVEGEEKIISENININDKNYSRCYYEDKPDNYTLYENASDGTSTDIYIYYLIQNNDRQDSDYVAKFIEAYNVMINNEVYMCEVWNMGGESDYYVYCKDNKIIAMDVIFYNKHEETVIEYMNEYAETEYISEPEHYNIHNSLTDENIKCEEE